MNNNPLVTVNILSFNRKDELRITLTKVFEQDYKNIEVIVVDNASSDRTQEMVRTEFPEVKLIELKKNIGIAGWNKGFEAAKGEYVLVLDDDSYPDSDSINKGLNAFYKDDRIGIVGYNIQNTRFNISETIDFPFNAYMFVGCGALISKQLINKIGGFSDLIFIYYHELEYSARCYSAGLKVIYLQDAKVFHTQSAIARTDNNLNPFTSKFRYYHYFISFSIFLLLSVDFKFYVVRQLKWILNRLLIAVVFSYYKQFFSAIYYLLKNFIKIYKKRKVVSIETQKFYNYGNHPLIDPYFFSD